MNIKKTASVRTGSRAWFAKLGQATITRKTWNDIMPDVIVVEAGGEEIVYREDGNGTWDLVEEITTPCRIGEALGGDLYDFVNEVAEDLATDDDSELNISIA